MKNFVLCVLSTLAIASVSCSTLAQTSTANGGAGGAGGSAAGGTATGGSSTNSNTTTGGAANIGSATSNYQGADVSVNYITPAGAAGVNGLAPGVDPNNNHLVTDANIRTSGTTRIKNTPDVNLGGPASGACNGLSGGVGVGIPGLAVGGNISTVDRGCEARETARVAAMLGRMDVANAILENMDVVVSAMKAKGAREAREAEAVAAARAQAQSASVAQIKIDAEIRAQQDSAREKETAAMRVQQQAGVEALTRQATMAKVNDTLTFTGKLTHGEEQTPQQLMAAELVAKDAAAKAAVASTANAMERVEPATDSRDAPAAILPVAAAPLPTAPPVSSGVASAATSPPLSVPEANQGQAKTDHRAERAPVMALAASETRATKRDTVADPQRNAPLAPAARKRGVPLEDPADSNDAVRFALGLKD